MDAEFERLIREAEEQPFTGWDFSYIRQRLRWGEPSWTYEAEVQSRFSGAKAVLDMGTGGGEFLASMAPLPARTVATEGYPPNVEIARHRLEPLGVEVVAVEGAPDNVEILPGQGIGTLPFADRSFPLVINRHESFYPAEVFRILEDGGLFVTQQVGSRHYLELDRLLGRLVHSGVTWDLAFAGRQLEDAGLCLVEGTEEYPEAAFYDVGAVVYFLKSVPWQVPDFSVARYRDKLLSIHWRIKGQGALRVHSHLFYLEAVRRGPEAA
jgi:hypothetical protein